MSCSHPNGICDCNFPWQAWADWVDPPPDPMTEEKLALLIERLGTKDRKIKQIILCTNPGTPSWMEKWWKND